METPNTIHLKDYQEPDYWCLNTDLIFDIFSDKTLVTNTSKYKRNGNSNASELTLDGVNLELVEVYVNSEPVSENRYRLSDSQLTIVELPSEFELTTIVKINPFENFSGEGLYKSGDILCTQCEAEGFRRITFFQDRPDVMSRFTTTIIADKKLYPTLLSNGNKTESLDLPEGRHKASWEDPFKKPCYLFALVAGELEKVEDTFTTADNREIALEIFVDPGNARKCGFAMESLKNSMKWDEERFGLIYDLDIYMIVAVDSFNMGAMENKGLNIFNSHYVLASQETATDRDFQGVEGVIGHEYFHNWTGNRVTCRDWFQLTLKEGLTVFRDQEFSSDMGSRAVKRIEDIARLKAHQFPEDQGSLSHPIQPKSYIEINNFYTATVYEKGAEVIRMIHTIIGEENFRKGIDLYFKRHDGQAVTCGDFLSAMSDASGIDLTHFSVWYDQNGTPKLNIDTEYDSSSKELTINIEQICKTNNSDFDSLYIPFKFQLYTSGGDLIKLGDKGDTILTSKTSKLVVSDIPVDCVAAFNVGFCAPVDVEYKYTQNELMILMSHAKDFYTRYNASELVKESEIKRVVELLREKNEVTSSKKFIGAIGKILNDRDIDLSFKAQLLALPTEKELFHKWDKYDFEVTKTAIKLVNEWIATSFKTEFMGVFDSYIKEQTVYEVNVDQIGTRAYFNQCISFLGYLGDSEFFKRLYEVFRKTDNMTIEYGCLSVLYSHTNDYQEKASNDFYQKWKSETLVTQKWLALLTHSENISITKLETLEKIPEYDEKVPNLVRSLIGSFSSNIAAVNNVSGEGYKFLAKKILQIDSYNPQLAARIAKNVNYLGRLDETRRNKLRNELKILLDSKELSKDSFEVIKAIVS